MAIFRKIYGLILMSGPTNPATPAQVDKGPLVGNPESRPFNITVSVPDQINIRMVDASALADYEIWLFLSSILSSAFIGFVIPYAQSREANSEMQGPYFWMSLTFFVLFLVSLGMAIGKRRALRKKGRDFKLKTSAIAEE